MPMPRPSLPSDVDIRVTADRLRASDAAYFQEIITNLVRENSLLSATIEEIGSQLSEGQAQLRALEEIAEQASATAHAQDALREQLDSARREILALKDRLAELGDTPSENRA